MSAEISGLIAATFTPFRADGSLDTARIPRMVDRLIAEGVEGFFVGGSTGEGVSQTVPERQTVARAFVEATAGRVPVIVQVGRDCLEEARILARHAHDIGADAISAVSPCYFTPPTVEVLVSCLERITSAAPDLPFFYYHIPRLSGAAFEMPAFLRVAHERIPSLAGLKYSATDVDQLQACIDQAAPDLRFFYGSDETHLSGISVGAHGAVGSTYNFLAPLFRELRTAFEASDLERARRLQGRAVEIIHAILPLGGLSALKATMRRIDLDCGPTRLPLPPLGKEREKELDRALDALEFDRLRQGETA